jgi:hypothetical protein
MTTRGLSSLRPTEGSLSRGVNRDLPDRHEDRRSNLAARWGIEGGMEMPVEAAVDPAGNLWMTLPRARSQIEQPSPNVSLGVKKGGGMEK